MPNYTRMSRLTKIDGRQLRVDSGYASSLTCNGGLVATLTLTFVCESLLCVSTVGCLINLFPEIDELILSRCLERGTFNLYRD